VLDSFQLFDLKSMFGCSKGVIVFISCIWLFWC